MEPRRPFDPLRPIEPLPSPLRPKGQYENLRDANVESLLREILDRLIALENRLKNIEDLFKARK